MSTEAAQINVINPNAAHSDNLYLFFAGAFAGIAGGALLMAVDAGFEPIRKRAVRSYDPPNRGCRPSVALIDAG